MKTKSSEHTRLKYAALALGVIAALVLAHSMLVGHSTDSSSDAVKASPALVETAVAKVRPMEVVVSAQGTIAPSQGASVQIAPANAGRLTSVLVREGDTVRAGEIVAVMDNRIPQVQVQSASAALRASLIQAQQAAINVRAAAMDHAGAVETAKLNLQAAQVDLRRLENGARPQEIAQAEQSIKQAQATRDRAATEMGRVQFLFDKGIDSKRQLEDSKTALSVADSQLVSAREQASLVRAGSRAEDLQAGRLRVKSAQAALKLAQQGSIQVAARQRETDAAVEAIRQKRADLAAAQATSAYSQLRSPISGKVTRRTLNPGDMADVNTPALEIADTYSLNLVASVPAEDGTGIRAGMKARVSPVMAPDRVFAGSVVNVGQVDPQSGMLAVRIAIPGSSSVLKIGGFAMADIIIRTEPAATVIPKTAVINRNGQSVVFVVRKDGAARKVAITTGVEHGDLIEIRSGIIPGERVVTVGQCELENGTMVRTASHNVRSQSN